MKRQSFLFVLLFLAVSLFAEIKLPAIFTDDMVLQQQTDAPIWGKASPGKDVKITISWDNKTYSVKAATDGSWKAILKTPSYGGPYTVTITDGKKLVLNNVMIGEIWLCSGQSNMEMPLAGWGEVKNFKQEIAEANYPNIRLLQVKKKTSYQPQSDLILQNEKWQVCSPATVPEFSSVAYFFGRNLHQNMNNIPIGLIDASWGGTIAEAWTSAESLETMPYFAKAVSEKKNLPDADAEKKYRAEYAAWEEKVMTVDKGFSNGNPVWASSDVNDVAWSDMSLPGLWEGNGLGEFDGIVWFRKTIDIPDDWAGKKLELSLGAIDDEEVTWFNGVKVGSTSGYNVNRVYTIPAGLVQKGKAVITVRVLDTGGGGGFGGNESEMYLKQEKSGKLLSLSGNWKYNSVIDFSKFPTAPPALGNPNQPSVLFNAMIHPITSFAIKGAIWYQGESNADRGYQYRDLFPLMIRDWRKQMNNDIPFYFVQLANFMEQKSEPQESNWAELREAQLKTLHLNNTGMAVPIDIGEAYDIHPKNKQDVGTRLALAARVNTYGQNIPYSGPIYQTYKVDGNKMRVTFTNADGGLKIKDGQTLKGFAIAGPDHKFYNAVAVIDGNEVIVSSPNVLFPVAVRYAWADNPDCNLYNGAGLPASPFRTDDWRRE
jgi:sialate O-acetylesterase